MGISVYKGYQILNYPSIGIPRKLFLAYMQESFIELNPIFYSSELKHLSSYVENSTEITRVVVSEIEIRLIKYLIMTNNILLKICICEIVILFSALLCESHNIDVYMRFVISIQQFGKVLLNKYIGPPIKSKKS